MATEPSPKPEKKESPLYYWEQYDAYECIGCGELIEVPAFAVLKIDGMQRNVRVRNQPENLMLWRELHELDHEKCSSFGDAAKALDAREHRKNVIRMPTKSTCAEPA